MATQTYLRILIKFKSGWCSLEILEMVSSSDEENRSGRRKPQSIILICPTDLPVDPADSGPKLDPTKSR